VAIYWLGMAVYRFKYSVFMKTTQLPRKNLKIGFQFFEASNVVIFVCGKSQKSIVKLPLWFPDETVMTMLMTAC